jgi:hypothetical protein
MSFISQDGPTDHTRQPTIPRTPPRVRVMRRGPGQAAELVPEEMRNLAEFHAAFHTAFGTANETIAEALFQQLANALHADPKNPLDDATANLGLALMYSIAPRDEIEAMLACQMVVAHVAAMDASRRALHVEQTAAGRVAYLGLTRTLMTLFAAQMDTLNRHRGKGTTQKIVVERVYVGPGAQAIVGGVASGGRGDGG